MQDRNRDADAEKGLVDTQGEAGVGRFETVALTYTTMCKIDG